MPQNFAHRAEKFELLSLGTIDFTRTAEEVSLEW